MGRCGARGAELIALFYLMCLVARFAAQIAPQLVQLERALSRGRPPWSYTVRGGARYLPQTLHEPAAEAHLEM
jgi:hypothetical protein